jgi:hypothetical protein
MLLFINSLAFYDCQNKKNLKYSKLNIRNIFYEHDLNKHWGIKKPEAIKLINYSQLKLSQNIGFRAIQIYNIIY